MNSLWQDLRYGVRMLMKKPGFTLIAVLTLALGIGANTAIFTVVNAVLLRQLPYPQAERIVAVGAQFSSVPLNAVDDPRFLFWYEHQQSFEALAAHLGGGGVNLAGDGLPELVPAQRVSVDFSACWASRLRWAAASRRKKIAMAGRRSSCSAMRCGNGGTVATAT
jgi:putative ABC transport system permease protein